METFQARYDRYRASVEESLQSLFLRRKPYNRLQEAMRYSLLAGGKRVRPVLTLAFCEALGGNMQGALSLGVALECVHTYSLIHDDLPCMDDDDLRRGRPTCHKVYGETLAVLAGDALQAEAFRLICIAPGLSAEQRVDAVQALASACGGDGMVAGQVLDVEGLAHDEASLRDLCLRKTGGLLCAAAELGCIAAGVSTEARRQAINYAKHIGLAFQVRDDMLDVIADQDEFGKPVGSDREEGKRTFADLLGLEDCGMLVAEETRLAKEAIAGFPDKRFLLELAENLANRRK
ncbi:MAG: polyprenyl synthetase family protein [Oscillospiraceae bacterium]|nr:polyprenyl synthetase family protein [Oscillospiraceae bacterium]